ncbi:ciliary neurotrophic factor receptor subunit alpha [Tachysurus ichikawai]
MQNTKVANGGRIQYGRIDSNVTMQCGSLDNDASVTWKVNGTDVKAKRREEGPRLILLEVDMSSNGLYSCFQNPDGQRRDQITFRIGQFSLLFLVHLSFFAILHSACFPDSFLIV